MHSLRSLSLCSSLVLWLCACGRIGYDARDAKADGPELDGGSMDARVEMDGALPDRPPPPDDDRPMLDAEPMTCPIGTVACGRDCADFERDVRHCGSCSSTCAAGQVCRMGMCEVVARAAAESECMEPHECGAGPTGPGICLSASSGWANGYCSFFCRTAADCGMNESCVNEPTAHVMIPMGMNGICLRRCTTPGQRAGCNAGHTCAMRGADNVCVSGCDMVNSACNGNECNLITGACVPCANPMQCSGAGACNMGQCSCTATTACGLFARCYTASGRCGCESDLFCGNGLRCNTATGECFRP